MTNTRTILRAALTMLALAFAAIPALAVKAIPHPVKVTQPDGTTLTIQVHGDEFLHWTTAGGALVSKGPDGFYYYAEFNNDGSVTRTANRVSSSFAMPTGISTVTPPPAAIAAAMIRRQAADAIRTGNGLGMGSNHFLVLLIEFSDLEFTVDNPNEAFSRLLNEPGYSDNGGTGSAADYYTDNSSGLFTPVYDVYGPIKVNGGYAEYGNNDQASERADYLLVEACQLADSEIDFSKYDLDNDGIVDNIFFFFAGHNEAEGAGDDYIWPHKWNVFRPSYSNFDGKRLDSYACTSEYSGSRGTNMAGIGTFCHEFGHVIGLPDFYDTDYDQNGYAAALGMLSLMDGGSYNNEGRTPPYLGGLERYILNWLEDMTEWTDNGVKTLQPVQNNAVYYIPTDNNGEFFLMEYRNGEGNDKYLHSTGIALYHVDQSGNRVGGTTARNLWANWGNYNSINSYAEHQCYDVIESCGYETVNASLGNVLFPGNSNVTTISPTSDMSLMCWDNTPVNCIISDISLEGSVATLTFNMSKSGDPIKEFMDQGINAIFLEKTKFNAGDNLELLLSLSNTVPATTEWYMDGQKQEAESVVLTSGTHILQAVLTYSDGSVETLTTKIEVQ